MLAEAVLPEHLEHEPAEVTDPLLAGVEERPALAAQLADGRREPIDAGTLIAAPEAGLRILSAAVVALAASLLVYRLT
jgi:hypothetical protein